MLIVGAVLSIVMVGPPIPMDNWSLSATLMPLEFSGSVTVYEMEV